MPRHRRRLKGREACPMCGPSSVGNHSHAHAATHAFRAPSANAVNRAKNPGAIPGDPASQTPGDTVSQPWDIPTPADAPFSTGAIDTYA